MTAPSSAPVPAIRLRVPGDVLGIVPAMLGFHPEESVVLLCLAGPRRQVRLTLRADLPDRPVASSARELVERAAEAGAEAIVAVIYSEAPAVGVGPLGLPHRRLARHLGRACSACGLEVLDVLMVGRGRWWSFRCEEPSCCPPEGTELPTDPTPDVLRYQAESVARGSRVWPRRADLVASVAPPDPARSAVLAPVFDAARDELESAAGEGADLRIETVHLFRDLHVRYREGGRRLDDAETARLALGLRDVHARDDVLGWGGGAHPGALLSLLGDLLRDVPPPHDPPAATVLAWVAYQSGDGALAQCALDRALASDPAYNLALLLQHAIGHAVAPVALAEVLDASRADSASDSSGEIGAHQ
jgi:hypothetical protein